MSDVIGAVMISSIICLIGLMLFTKIMFHSYYDNENGFHPIRDKIDKKQYKEWKVKFDQMQEKLSKIN